MTEEIKDSTEKPVVPYIGKPPMEYYARLSTLDDRSFIGEMRKKSRENRGAEPISAVIALVLMGDNAKGNDPYMLDSKSQKKKTYDMYQSKPRGGRP